MDYAALLQSEGYRRGEVVEVPVTFLMKFLNRSCDVGSLTVWYEARGDDDWRDYSGWAYLMESKSQDEGFGYLVESMLERGMLPNGAIAVDPTGYLFEGHHRLVAAILLCMDTVFIKYGSTSHYNDRSLPNISAYGNGDRPSYPIYVEYV